MKKILLFLLVLGAVKEMTAQTGRVGIGTNTPNAKAILDLSSNNKGFLPPRISEDSLNAMGNVTEGMVAYNTTRNCLMSFYKGSWKCLTGGSTDKYLMEATSTFSGADSSTTSEILDMEKSVMDMYYVAGNFSGNKLNLGNGVELSVTAPLAAATHGFIAKYDNTGRCRWAVKLNAMSSTSVIQPNAIAVNDDGTVFITGTFKDSMYIYNANGTYYGSLGTAAPGDYDLFILKITTDGAMAWSRKEGSAGGREEGLGITLVSSKFWICGQFHGTQTLGTAFPTFIISAGAQDGFYAEYDTLTGTDCFPAFRIGGTQDDVINDISANGGYVYFTGSFENSITLIVTGVPPAAVNSLGGPDMFVCKSLTGSIEWVLYGRGAASEIGQKIFVTGGQVYGAVNFSSASTSFRLDHATASSTPPAQQSKGSADAMLFRINSLDGSYVVSGGLTDSWITTMGGTGTDRVRSLDVGGGLCYIAGEYNKKLEFENGYALFSSGGTDGFAATLASVTGDLYKAATISSLYDDKCTAIVRTTGDAFAVVGSCFQPVLINGATSGKPFSQSKQAFISILK